MKRKLNFIFFKNVECWRTVLKPLLPDGRDSYLLGAGKNIYILMEHIKQYLDFLAEKRQRK